MKFKNKGRKIYKTKEKNYYGKSPMGKFLSGALTVLLIGGICFLGYSVAEPIINYTKHKGDEPVTTEPPTSEASTEPTECNFVQPTEALTEAPTEATEPVYYTAAVLKFTDLASVESLRAALSAVPAHLELEYIEVPLKIKGGNVYFASTVYEAQTAMQSVLTLPEIIQEIENCGYKAAAFVSVFRDNILPANFFDAGYVYASSGALWTDMNGQAWASPYAQRALDYNTNLILELSRAGFEQIICSDFVFPDFTEADLLNLDPVLSQNDRCMSLTSAANLLYDTAVSNGAAMQIEVSAEDIIMGRTDVLQPILLSANNIILNIDIDVLNSGITNGENVYTFSGSAAEKIDQCIGMVNEKLVDFNVAARISGGNLTVEEISEVRKVLTEYGYKTFVIG